jgi:hypothetical protein
MLQIINVAHVDQVKRFVWHCIYLALYLFGTVFIVTVFVWHCICLALYLFSTLFVWHCICLTLFLLALYLLALCLFGTAFVWHCICFCSLKKNVGLETQTKGSSRHVHEKFHSLPTGFL